MKVPKLSHMKVLKYGAMGTVGGSIGAYIGGSIATQPLESKHESGKSLAKAVAALGIVTTGAIIGRKYIKAAAIASAQAIKQTAQKDSGVIYRRIRGRIVPIKVKKP